MSDYRGLGLDQLMIKFLELYSDPKVLVLALNTKSTEEVHIRNVDVIMCLCVWCVLCVCVCVWCICFPS